MRVSETGSGCEGINGQVIKRQVQQEVRGVSLWTSSDAGMGLRGSGCGRETAQVWVWS